MNNPVLSDVVVQAAQDPELLALGLAGFYYCWYITNDRG